MQREIRLSADGNAVAIRTDHGADTYNAWAVMHVLHGGAWCGSAEVADWAVISPNG